MYFHKTLNNLSIHPWKPSFYELENVEQFSSSSATGWTSEGGHGLFSGERWGDPGEASHIYRYLFSSLFSFLCYIFLTYTYTDILTFVCYTFSFLCYIFYTHIQIFILISFSFHCYIFPTHTYTDILIFVCPKGHQLEVGARRAP